MIITLSFETFIMLLILIAAVSLAWYLARPEMPAPLVHLSEREKGREYAQEMIDDAVIAEPLIKLLMEHYQQAPAFMTEFDRGVIDACVFYKAT